MSYLLDTNVISETRKSNPNSSVLSWIADLSSSELYTSVFTLGELWKGVINIRMSNSDKAVELGQWIRDISNQFHGRIIPESKHIAASWGEIIVAWEEIKGAWERIYSNQALPVIDSMILATAKAHGMTVVTRNTKDMTGLGVPVINPWQEPYPSDDDTA